MGGLKMNVPFISNWAGVGTQSRQVTPLIDSPKIKSLTPEYIKNNHEAVGLAQLYPKSLKSPLNQSDSEIITNGNKLQLSQASKGKADELSVRTPPENIRNGAYLNVDNTGKPGATTTPTCKREPIDKPHCSRSAGLDNKLQSPSAEPHKKRPEEENAKTDKINSSEKLGTPDTLKSSEVHCISSVDTAEGTFLNRKPIPTNLKPSAVTPIYKEGI